MSQVLAGHDHEDDPVHSSPKLVPSRDGLRPVPGGVEREPVPGKQSLEPVPGENEVWTVSRLQAESRANLVQ